MPRVRRLAVLAAGLAFAVSTNSALALFVNSATTRSVVNYATELGEVEPLVLVAPGAASIGAIFTASGTGFTANSTVTSHLKKPDGTEFPTLTMPTDSFGSYMKEIDSAGFAPGFYQHWALDDATGISSNVATFEVVDGNFDFALDWIGVDGNILDGGDPDGLFDFIDQFDDGSLTAFPTSEITCIGGGNVVESDGFLRLRGIDGGNRFTPTALVDNCQLGADPTSAYQITDGQGNVAIVATFRADVPIEGQAYGLQIFTQGTSDVVNIQLGNCGDTTCVVATSLTPTEELKSAPVDLSGLERVLLQLVLDDATNQVTPSISLDNGDKFIEIIPAHRTIFEGGDKAIVSVFGAVQIEQSDVNPTVSVVPQFGPPGTQFTAEGLGFTPNSTVTSHLQRPDGSEFVTLTLTTDSTGSYTHSISSSGFAPGVYTHWAVDSFTGVVSPKATFEVTVPTVSVDPDIGTAGTIFTSTGIGFTASGLVTTHLRKPNGSEFPPLAQSTDSTGTFTHTIDSVAFDPGIYTYWAIDDTTGARSNEVVFEVTSRDIPPQQERDEVTGDEVIFMQQLDHRLELFPSKGKQKIVEGLEIVFGPSEEEQIYLGLVEVLDGTGHGLGGLCQEALARGDVEDETATTLCTAGKLAAREFVSGQLSRLASSLVEAGLGAFDAYSLGGRMVVAGSNVGARAVLGEEPIGEAVLRALAVEVSVPALRRLVGDYLARPLGSFTVSQIEEMLEREDVRMATTSGAVLDPLGGGLVTTHVTYYYNPWTHYVTSYLHTEGTGRVYVVYYEIDSDGMSVSDMPVSDATCLLAELGAGVVRKCW